MWNNDKVQFARLISEIDSQGGFTKKLLKDLCDTMDLELSDIYELIERATNVFDNTKAKI